MQVEVLTFDLGNHCRCKSSKQLQDPQLTAAAAAAVAEAEAEEQALAVAIEAIARLPPKPNRGPRRSLCFEVYLQILDNISDDVDQT